MKGGKRGILRAGREEYTKLREGTSEEREREAMIFFLHGVWEDGFRYLMPCETSWLMRWLVCMRQGGAVGGYLP